MRKAARMAKESYSTIQARFTKEKWWKILSMERDWKYTQMVPDSKDSLSRVWNKEEAFSNGATGRYMMANGRLVARMEVACGKEPMVNLILDNGKMVKCKDLESMWWKMDQDMKVSSEIHWNTVLGHKDSIILRHMSAIIRRIDQMAKGSTIGQTVIITKANFLMDWDTAKAISDKERRGFNIEDSIKMTRSAAMAKSIMQMA